MSKNSITSISARASHLFTNDDHALSRETIVAAMTATKTARSRNAAGKIIYVQEPDWAIRLPAAVKVAEFVGGKPVAMSLSADLTPRDGLTGNDEFLQQVLRNPDARDAFRETAEKMIAAAEKMHPIDVVSLPAEAEPAPS